MLDSKVFYEQVLKGSITVEPCPNSDKLQITVDGDFIRENVYNHLECRVKEYMNFISIENDFSEICRINFNDGENRMFLSKRESLGYARLFCDKINTDIKYSLNMIEDNK